ncbi:unnamed protein product [Penicillium nalgiovense]|nr:unnamed protein product [Penicillium nalgiovense]
MSLTSLRNLRTQWFPPKAAFTEKELPSQKGRVFIVTGGNAGVGFELCKILYGSGATIYMASRSKASLWTHHLTNGLTWFSRSVPKTRFNPS